MKYSISVYRKNYAEMLNYLQNYENISKVVEVRLQKKIITKAYTVNFFEFVNFRQLKICQF